MKSSATLLKIAGILITISTISFIVAYMNFDYIPGTNYSFSHGWHTKTTSDGWAFLKEKIEFNRIKEFELKNINSIELETKIANFEINEIFGNVIVVKYEGAIFWRDSKEPGPEITEIWAEQSGDKLRIKIEYYENASFSYRTNAKLILSVPHQYKGDIYAKSISGDGLASIANIGKFKIKSVSGDFTADKVHAKQFEMEATSGDLTIHELKSNSFSVDTVSGDLKISNLESQSAKTSTTSGDTKIDALIGGLDHNSVSGELSVRVDKLNNDFKASLVSGDVEIDIPEESDIKMDLTSTSGDIESELPLTFHGKRKRRATGKFGEGRLSLNVTTTSGDVSINAR